MFIVIEGIDGAGCETQGKNLTRELAKLAKFKNKKISLIKLCSFLNKNVGGFFVPVNFKDYQKVRKNERSYYKPGKSKEKNTPNHPQ